jgi:hypothetical protein
MPRSSADDMPALSAVAVMAPAATPRGNTAAAAAAGASVGEQLSASFVVAYDDIASVRYYGTAFKGRKTRLLAPFDTENHRFTKTGSGQT